MTYRDRRLAAGFAVVLGVCGLVGGIRLAAQDDQPAVEKSDERAVVNPKLLEFLKPVTAVDGDDELTRKLKERHNLAVELFEARGEQYKRNIGSLDAVLEAARVVVDAKLDLAPDAEARLAVFEHSLEIARLIEQHHQALHDAGIGTVTDMLRARLARASVEVQILKAKRQP